MSYTVVGLFPNNEMAADASNRLNAAGFAETDYKVSSYRTEGEVDAADYDYDEDENTKGFWSTLFGTNESERKAYSYAGTKSNVVTVYTDDADRAEKARQIMDDAGAISVDESLPETFYAQNPDYRRTADVNRVADRDLHTADDKIEVVKEDINVGKKEVHDGGIRIKSRIIEKPVEESVRLKEERVYIKRNPVNRAVDANAAFQNSTIEMTQSKEVPVVDKTARVVEEISLGKDVEHREETITDTVRETQIDVEDARGNRLDENGNIINDENRI